MVFPLEESELCMKKTVQQKRLNKLLLCRLNPES